MPWLRRRLGARPRGDGTDLPELVEVELYRRAADAVVGRQIDSVFAPLVDYVRNASPPELRTTLVGARVEGTDRVGKLLVLHTDRVALGLRFGMSGRIVVDGTEPIETLLYSPSGDGGSEEGDPIDDLIGDERQGRWCRFALGFAHGGSLAIIDPRRLGSVEPDPDLGRLGPDALTVTAAQLDAALGASSAPLKARLLDQGRLAGVGNLAADEILWRAGLDPTRAAGSLDQMERRGLARVIRATMGLLLERGGSHLGDLVEHRRSGGCCPRDGAALVRATVGGRTTWWCPLHQRTVP